MKKSNTLNTDLTDSPRDAEKLKGDKGSLNLPEWNDIPGQKKSTVSAVPGDVTASSSDEEGEGILDDNENGEEVSGLDREMLNKPYDPSYDSDLAVDDISLDDTDNDGDLLEEGGLKQSLFGQDLDDNLEEEEDEEDQDSNGNPE